MAYLITDECLICGTCWEICPTRSIKEHEWYYKITTATCAECGSCIRVCPNVAIRKEKSLERQKGNQ